MSEHVRMWIGGAWVDAEDGATFEATSPSTGEVIGTVPKGTRADAGRAISAAQAAWPGWAGLSAFERAEGLFELQASEISLPLGEGSLGRRVEELFPRSNSRRPEPFFGFCSDAVEVLESVL